MGIYGDTFVRVEKLAFGLEAREQAIAAAQARLGEVIEHAYRRAAYTNSLNV
jgi:FMN-dependent NADH-azoreductase